MRTLSWLVAMVVGVTLLLFALDNRDMVALGFWPLPMTMHIPLFAAILGAGGLGFLIGGTMAWVRAGRWRRLARRREREVETLGRQVKALEEAASAATPPPAVSRPVLRLAAVSGG
ncbi:MAG: DUF1049 domain-containing protein [Alphaproteobacteria bacterium]|nr:DUF1049 domain-containing protein [Alphaproteobacteria bacterium]